MPTILLADDNEDSRVIYGTFFEAFGFTVYQAVDGEEAVALAHSEVPDVVLLNLYMPGKSGQQVLEELKASDTTSGCRCVVLTGEVRHARMGDALVGGAEAYLMKPAEPREVLEMVQAILAEPRA